VRKHCKCGYQLWVPARWNGVHDSCHFIADQEGEPEQGEEIRHCPGCGNQLREDELLSAYEADEMKWRDKAAVWCELPGPVARLFPLYEANYD